VNYFTDKYILFSDTEVAIHSESLKEGCIFWNSASYFIGKKSRYLQMFFSVSIVTLSHNDEHLVYLIMRYINEFWKDSKLKTIYRISISVVLLTLLLGFSLALSSRPALAKSTTSTVAARSCYSEVYYIPRKGWYYKLQPNVLYQSPWLRTSKYCRDINMNFITLSSPVLAQVCFKSANTCTAWKTYNRKNVWYLPATNVRDNIDFRINFRVNRNTSMSVMVAS
jgi:hypothetical protein